LRVFVCVCVCFVTGNVSVCHSVKCLGRLRRFGVRIAGELREFYLFRNVQSAYGSHSAFHSLGTEFCLSERPEGGGTGNEWSYTSTPPIRFHGEDRYIFTFAFVVMFLVLFVVN